MSHDAHTLAGPYALDALGAGERHRFERHLPGCATCAEQVAGLRETAARLALAAAVPPPDTLHERVMTQIDGIRQAPPPLRSPRRSLGRVRRVPGRLAAAACVMLTLVSAGAAAHWRGDARDAQELNRRITAVLAAPDARVATVRAAADAGGGTLTLVASRSGDTVLVTASGLRPLPAARTYQLWFLGSARPRPAGFLPAAGRGPVLAAGLRDARRLGVTVEPARGSSQPTGAPVVTVPLD
ncbi:anti-sigma factor [Actinomadura rayongensis]|uniref:Regulator of SigK n=1 Tax=Actinomadura rayongensis TaxID=1429076 RepID=A0A6I4W0X8_9ACTN|nr:anti-sigma factor [Actinomadura rayongensis]MXQ63133.1 hypothetical protein [Actinomadura rayongensis]